jgi:hypothetical protein
MKNTTADKEEKFAMILRFQGSGLSGKQFAEQEHISYNNFNYWLKRYRKQYAEPSKSRFIKLPAPGKTNTEAPFSEVVLANGNRIRFYQHVSSSELKQIAS